MNTTPPTSADLAVERIIAAGSLRPGTLQNVMRDFGERLRTAGAFEGLTAAHAVTLAATISWCTCQEADGPGEMLKRAESVTAPEMAPPVRGQR